MCIYYINSLYSLIVIGLARKMVTMNRSKANILIYYGAIFSSFVLAWAIASLRIVGRDRINYELVYKSISGMTSITELPKIFESGYELYNFFLSRISNSEIFLFSVTSFIILLIFYWFIFKYSSYPELSIFLFFMLDPYIASWSLLRQYLAIAIVLYAMKFLNKNEIKDKLYFVGFVILASYFHSSALVCIPMIFISNKLNIRRISVLVLIGVLVMITAGNKLNLFELIAIVSNKYQGYQYTIYSEYGASPLHLVKQFVICIWIWLGIRYGQKNIEQKNSTVETEKLKITYKFINYMFISLGITALATKYVIFSRINIYFSIFAIVLIPDMLRYYKPKTRIMLIFALIIISVLYFYVIVNYTDSYSIIPYESFLQL